ELDTSAGLTPEAAEDGSIRFHDESGRRVAELPPPILLDSTPGEPQVSHDVHYELAPGADHGWLLTVNAETEWLAKPDLTWPIHLDPTMTLPSPELDCAIVATEGSEGSGLCGSKGQKQLYGRYRHVMFSNGTSKEEWARSLLRFNLSGLPGASAEPYISSATLHLHSPSAALNTTGVEARQVSRQWDSGLNWRKASSLQNWDAEGGDYLSEGTQILTSSRGSQAGWWDFDLTSLVQKWSYFTDSSGKLSIEPDDG